MKLLNQGMKENKIMDNNTHNMKSYIAIQTKLSVIASYYIAEAPGRVYKD